MIVPGISTIRRTHNSHPDVGLTTVAFAAILLVVGLGSQQANGFVIDTHSGNHAGGKQGELLDMARLKPLKEFKGDHHSTGKRSEPEPGELRDVKLILRGGAYYDKSTMLCVCDVSRSYPVIPSMPEEQRAGYCVQICGASLEGVQSNAPSTTSTTETPLAVSTPPPTRTSASTSSKPTEESEEPVAPSAPVAPTPPTAPTAPQPPTAPTAPTAPTGPTGPSTGTGTGNVDSSNGDSKSGGTVTQNSASGNGGDDNTALKIGVGVAVGVIMSAVVGFCLWFCLRKRNKRRQEEEGIAFGCVGDQTDVHPALRSEKYIYAGAGNDSKHTVNSKHSHNRTTPPSPRSIPPAYSAPAGGVIPSSTNTSSTSLDTNPPILPLGAPSRVLDMQGNRPFVPGNLNNNNGSVSPTPKAAGPSSGVQPPSITFFLHPVKNDTELEEEERRWLDEEQRRIREKKEAVEELNKLRAEEDKIREKIRERMMSGR